MHESLAQASDMCSLMHGTDTKEEWIGRDCELLDQLD
jgi:hypothetical protein